jgi:hypothetical protein
MRSMMVEANLELRELSKFIEISDDLYDRTGIIIDNIASEYTHMNVSHFVDMCLNLARCEADLNS